MGRLYAAESLFFSNICTPRVSFACQILPSYLPHTPTHGPYVCPPISKYLSGFPRGAWNPALEHWNLRVVSTGGSCFALVRYANNASLRSSNSLEEPRNESPTGRGNP